MNVNAFIALRLRLHLALLRTGPVTLLTAFAFALISGIFVLVRHTSLQVERDSISLKARAEQQALTAHASVIPAALPMAPVSDNLALFYAALGERRYTEQQVKTLFDLAAKNGLTLREGEYKSGYDRNAHVCTYQVDLPVKGSYHAIWQFALAALRTIPFASLDDITFHRDAIGDPQVEARLRLTFYLAGDLAASGAGSATHGNME